MYVHYIRSTPAILKKEKKKIRPVGLQHTKKEEKKIYIYI